MDFHVLKFSAISNSQLFEFAFGNIEKIFKKYPNFQILG